MLKSINSFSLLYWMSYLLWIYSQISSNSSNVVFSIIILENLQKSLWIMRNQNNEKIETNNWTRLLIEERESDILKKFEKNCKLKKFDLGFYLHRYIVHSACHLIYLHIPHTQYLDHSHPRCNFIHHFCF